MKSFASTQKPDEPLNKTLLRNYRNYERSAGGDFIGDELKLRDKTRSHRRHGTNRRRLGRLPPHDGHCADAVLRAARDDPVTVGYIDQDIALAIKEADDLKRLEDKAAVFVKDALAVLELAQEPNRPDLATGNAGVARILRYAQSAFDAAGLGPGDMAGHTLDLGVVEAVHHDLVIRTDPSKLGAHRAGRPAFGAAKEPPSEKHDDQQDSRDDNH